MAKFPIVPPRFRAFDANGDPLAGGLLYAYEAGTTTPLDTFTTRAGSVANANPVVLDANGEADVWLTPGLLYKFVLKSSAGVTQWTVDNHPATEDLSMADGNVSAPGLAFTDDVDTGFYRPAADQLGISAGGALSGLFTASQALFRDGLVGAPGIGFKDDADNGAYRIGANNWALAAAGTKQLELTSTHAKAHASVASTAADPTTALELANGHLKFSGTNPNADEAFTNQATGKSVPRAWARLQTNGAGGVSVIDGFNITGATVDASKVEVTMGSAVTDAAKAIGVATIIDGGGSTTIHVLRITFGSTTTFRIEAMSITTAPAVANVNPSTTILNIAVVIFAAQ